MALAAFASQSNAGAFLGDFVDMVTHDDRTTQQDVGRVIVALLEEWASAFDRREYDDRNVHLCRFAKVAMEDAGWCSKLPKVPDPDFFSRSRPKGGASNGGL